MPSTKSFRPHLSFPPLNIFWSFLSLEVPTRYSLLNLLKLQNLLREVMSVPTSISYMFKAHLYKIDCNSLVGGKHSLDPESVDNLALIFGGTWMVCWTKYLKLDLDPFFNLHTSTNKSWEFWIILGLGADSSLQLPCNPNDLGTTHPKLLPSKSTSLYFHSEMLHLGIHFNREVDVSITPTPFLPWFPAVKPTLHSWYTAHLWWIIFFYRLLDVTC